MDSPFSRDVIKLGQIRAGRKKPGPILCISSCNRFDQAGLGLECSGSGPGRRWWAALQRVASEKENLGPSLSEKKREKPWTELQKKKRKSPREHKILLLLAQRRNWLMVRTQEQACPRWQENELLPPHVFRAHTLPPGRVRTRAWAPSYPRNLSIHPSFIHCLLR